MQIGFCLVLVNPPMGIMGITIYSLFVFVFNKIDKVGNFVLYI